MLFRRPVLDRIAAGLSPRGRALLEQMHHTP
jgi:hypothetical protein